jgi:DNA-binding transcriptional regulator GbsR (MarR family)
MAGKWHSFAETIFMESYHLKLEAPWSEVKDMLQEINPELNDEDLQYEAGNEKELLERISAKINKDLPSVKAWIESVSHNKGLAY